jgi:hypothetical protein
MAAGRAASDEQYRAEAIVLPAFTGADMPVIVASVASEVLLKSAAVRSRPPCFRMPSLSNEALTDPATVAFRSRMFDVPLPITVTDVSPDPPPDVSKASAVPDRPPAKTSPW